VCQQDGIELVNIVRKPEQAELLRGMGARHVLDSTSPTFMKDLTEAVATTGATLGFDAIGGGRLAGQILACMESAISRSASEYSRYGSTVHKQVYIYGALDRSPTEIVRSFGLTWGLGGWLLFPALQKLGPDLNRRIRERVAAELTTTFASRYTKRISLEQALDLQEIAVYGRQATGTKFLLCPHQP
jgi:NADPH2:quinone reductase